MKQIFISLNLIILFFFLTINYAYCEEDFLLDTPPYYETKNKLEFPVSKTNENNIETQKEAKQGLFLKLISKKNSNENKKQKKFNSLTNKQEEIPKGYYGKIPNIEGDFKYKQQSSSISNEIDAKIPVSEDLIDENLKKAPFNDTLFLDNVIKKTTIQSDYLKDIHKIKFALENLKKCIENKEDIQRFNACVNVIDLYCKNFKNKYENQSDCLKESYNDILNTNYKAKVLGNLMYDANYYARYIPTQQGKYSKENIDNQKQELLNDINKTLFVIINEE